MPEHDLLMQLNKDMKFVCGSVGRVEQQVTDIKDSFKTHCIGCEKMLTSHDVRISTLEGNDKRRTGIAIGVSAVVSAIAWIIMVMVGVIG